MPSRRRSAASGGEMESAEIMTQNERGVEVGQSEALTRDALHVSIFVST